MKFFWEILIAVEALSLVILFLYWRRLKRKKDNFQIISYREMLQFRKVSRLCCVFIIGGIISAFIVLLNL
jgi:hypothetical protein